MRSALLSFTLALALPSAAPAEPALAPADRAFFEKKVRPLLFNRCLNCHSVGGKKRGGLLLDSRAGLLRGGETGPAVVPGQPGKGLLVEAVRYDSPRLQMPPAGKLPASEIAILEEWARRGAPFPGPEKGALARGPINFAQGRKFWSFQPLRSHVPPGTRLQSWARKPIDLFLLAELEKRDLAPSPLASRRVLIRRASFDLIGLPPAPEEVEAFEGDERPDAYERLIDRLLASPAHGERWGRFWLDLARYCDVAEPWAGRKSAPYLYRDWVVQALNRDLPFDQFGQFQLAADLLPGPIPSDRAALGLLGLSPTYWKELKLDKDVIKNVVAEEWEERIHTVTSTFLGLTVSCARCHDHKFDPIAQADYYALAGVFASTRQADRPLVADVLAAPAQKARERVAELQTAVRKLQAVKPVAAVAQKQMGELRAQIERFQKTPGYSAPLAPAVEDASLLVLPDGPHRTRLEYRVGAAQDVPIHVRGNAGSPGRVVPRRFLPVLAGDAPTPFRQGSGRGELAGAIFREGGPLAARVIVNRVWTNHFGAGLVGTPSDFGAQGDRPTHPELLDDLAARFVERGWSLKWLHREIVLSAAYRQSSAPGNRSLGEDNRWLGRMNRRRLEIEAWRDAALAVAGTLRLEQGGPPGDLGGAGNLRRTLYGTVKRRELHDLLRLHDFPDPTTHSPRRTPTITPLQQLFVLNSAFVKQQSAALARRVKREAPAGTEARVRRAYQLLFQRHPTAGQMRLAVAFLTEGAPGREPSESLWEQYAQVLLASNEFLFID